MNYITYKHTHKVAGPDGSLCDNAKCPIPHMLITTATHSQRAACWLSHADQTSGLPLVQGPHQLAAAATHTHTQTFTDKLTDKDSDRHILASNYVIYM